MKKELINAKKRGILFSRFQKLMTMEKRKNQWKKDFFAVLGPKI